MGQRELQGRCPNVNPVGGAYLVDALGPCQDGGIRRTIIVGGAGSVRGREQPGVVRAADDHCHAAPPGLGQQVQRRGVLEQRVAAGEQDDVQVRARQEFKADLDLVDADANRPAGARAAQVTQGGQRLIQHLPEHRVVPLAMRLAPDVMDQQGVHRLALETPKTGFERPKGAVTTVVEACAPALHGKPVVWLLATSFFADVPADLGRNPHFSVHEPRQRLA